MSKHTSRLKRIEESLNPSSIPTITGVVMVGWFVPEDAKYFTNEAEEEEYQKWRIDTIEGQGSCHGESPRMTIYSFDEDDVRAYIEKFHEFQFGRT